MGHVIRDRGEHGRHLVMRAGTSHSYLRVVRALQPLLVMRTSHARATVTVLTLALAGTGCVADGDILDDPPTTDPTPPTQPVDEPPDDPPQEETLSQATERVLGQWMRCMTLEDFRAANMVAWGSMAASGATCASCHATGGGGFIASTLEQPFFTALAENRYYLLQYVTVDLTMGAALAKVVINETSLRGVSLGQVPHAEHPRFNATVSPGMTALRRFYDLTVDRLDSPACATTVQ